LTAHKADKPGASYVNCSAYPCFSGSV